MSRFISKVSIVILLVALIGYTSNTFAKVSFSTSLGSLLSERNAGAQGIASMFGGKGKVTNIYGTVLKLVKDNEVKTTFDSIQSVMEKYPEFVPCGVKDDDIVVLLYSTDDDFRTAMDLTVLDASQKEANVPDLEELTKIYRKIASCRAPGKKTFDVTDYDDVRMVLSSEYRSFIVANFDKQTLSQVNFGDDMYVNATLDDSDYDLLIDIEKIGNKFFQSFTSPVQTLFYELPNIGGGGGGGGGGLGGPGTPGGSFGTSSDGGGDGDDLDDGGDGDGDVIDDSGVGVDVDDLDAGDDMDAGVQDFIEDTNSPVYSPDDLYTLPPNECLSGVPDGLPLDTGAFQTPDEYQDFLEEAIYLIGLDPTIEGPATYPQSDEDDDILDDDSLSPGTSYPPGTPNEWVEEMLDDIGGECADTCELLESDQIMPCVTDCLVTCTESCEGLDVYDKIYCESQCLCKKISGPLGEEWKGMENMYAISFCTIPVENNRVTGGKKVYSIEAIFDEIKTVFGALLGGGEMIKRTKPKEYFDTSLSDIKFNDIFSFQITTAVKPLYSNVSDSTKREKQKRKAKEDTDAILGMQPADENKYVIIADVAQNQVDRQQILSLKDWQEQIDALNTLDDISKITKSDAVEVAKIGGTVELNEKVLDFIISNVNFWDATNKILTEINGMAVTLKKKIEDSPKK